MTQVESIQAAIEALSGDDFAQLRAWFEDRDWDCWDKQIEGAAAEGKLNFLVEEAQRAEQRSDLREL